MKRHGAFFLVLLVLSTWVSGYYADCDTVPPDGSVLVTFDVVDNWGEGYEARISITNGADWSIESWVLEFDLESQMDELLDGTVAVQGAGRYTVVPVDPSAVDISPGETVSFGYLGSPGGAVQPPTSGSLNGYPVSFNAWSPAPPPEAGQGASQWPARVLAPYVDTTAWPAYDFVATSLETGLPFYTLGFIVTEPGTSCEPSWGGYYDMDANYLVNEVAALRAIGGDIIVSFGGAANAELAVTCEDDATLARAYQEVIDLYGATRVDFDIEGAWLAEPLSVERRARVVADLQAQALSRGGTLDVWFTLPVMPDGLTPDGVHLVETVLAAGVDLGGVNLMTMDYGPSVGSYPDMGELAISAAVAVHEQLESIYLALGQTPGPDDTWNRVGITPMIGVNDITDEVFLEEDAEEVLGFALEAGVGLLAYWSANRDQPCDGGATGEVSSSCSGIDQERYGFLDAFLPFLP